MLVFDFRPYRFGVPMYDRITAGRESAFALSRIVVCFTPPYVAPPHGAPG